MSNCKHSNAHDYRIGLYLETCEERIGMKMEEKVSLEPICYIGGPNMIIYHDLDSDEYILGVYALDCPEAVKYYIAKGLALVQIYHCSSSDVPEADLDSPAVAARTAEWEEYLPNAA